ncbi:hypothetical protein DRN69_01305 [Candidatus Pacearchaeota archaeon]|nr:MAG: hypothetical protein DRN69_01305 [Candidatus Pacearchaeota archaeon]
MDKKEKQKIAREILEDIYLNGYIETIYNTPNMFHRREGWVMKNGLWSPWYFNVRPVGSTPKIVAKIGYAMNNMLRDEIPDLTQIVAVEMCGVPLASVVSTAYGEGTEFIPYAYTRPLPGPKVRNPEEAQKILSEFKGDVHGYGSKRLVEGRFKDNDVLCIIDDVVTSFGSKLIAKLITEYEVERQGMKGVSIDHVAVVMDREQGAEGEAKKHGMQLHALIRFKSEGLSWIKDIMYPKDYEIITDYLEDSSKYQDPDFRKKILDEAVEEEVNISNGIHR